VLHEQWHLCPVQQLSLDGISCLGFFAGVPARRDARVAARWYRRSAKQGYARHSAAWPACVRAVRRCGRAR
jgi:hypothetical protein